MKKVFLLIMLVLVVGIVSSCKEDKEVEQKLVYNLGPDPKTWDPGFNTAVDGGHLIANMFEGLYRDTPEGAKPAGIEKVDVSTDHKTYTFHLRRDAKWSNGEPVTAHDYRFAWLRVIDPEYPSEYAYIMYPYIKNGEKYYNGECEKDEVGITVVDDFTLKLELEMVVPYIESLLAFYPFMPIYSNKGKITALEDGWEKKPQTMVTNGPFKFVEYTMGKRVLMAKNEYYYNKDKVKLEELEFVIVEDANTALNAYNKGEIHVLDAVPADEIANLLSKDSDFKITSELGTYFFVFNMDHEYLGNPNGENGYKLRKALSMVIDRESIVNNISRGGEIPAGAFVPPTILDSKGDPWYDPDKESPYGINTGEVTQKMINDAKKLFNEALEATKITAKDLAESMEIAYNNDTAGMHKLVCSYIKEAWKEAFGDDFDVELIAEEWQVFLDARTRGEYAFARHGWIGDYPHPNTMLDLWVSTSGNNDAQWRYKEVSAFPHDTFLNEKNEKFDELIYKAMNETDPVKGEEYLREAEKIILQEELILTPIYHYTRKQLINSDKVKGVKQALMGAWYFGDAERIG